jgi:membrane fusion protein, multidrug efflux system
LVAIAAFVLSPKSTAARNGPLASGKTAAPATGNEPPAIPVTAVRARRGNVGVYFTGLGTVTPIYTVTVKTQVTGQLVAVNYREGDMVQKGDLLAQIDPRPYQAALTQAEGQLLRDQALLDNARIDLKRYQVLVPQKAAPEQMLATQQATVHQDEGTVKLDQGLVDAAKTNLDFTRITAPITGLAGLRLVDPGNIVQISDTTGLAVLTQIDPISVIFTLSEDQLPAVLAKTRAKQTLEVDAYSRDMSKKLAQGTLTTIDNQIDQTTGTDRIRATFGNKNNALFPNQFVNARLLVEEKRNVVLLPTAAVQRNSDTTFVYLVKPDSTVTIRNITLGTTEGDVSEVTSGLNPGDTAVMSGADKLQEGGRVNAQIQNQEANSTTNPSQAAPSKPASNNGKGAKK